MKTTKTKSLKRSVIFISASTLAASLFLTSCNDNKELIAKVENTQRLIEQNDSILKVNQSELTAFFSPDSSQGKVVINPLDSLQKVYVDQHQILLLKNDSLFQTSKTILAELTEKSIDTKEAEEKQIQLENQLQVIKTSDSTIMAEYKKFTDKLDETFKKLSDEK